MAFKPHKRCCALPIFLLLVLILHALVAHSDARTVARVNTAQEKMVARDPRWDERERNRNRWRGWDRGGWNNNGGWDEGGNWNEGGGWNNRPPWSGGGGGRGPGDGGRK